MWYDERLFYQIYPLGLCGAPRINDGIAVSRLTQLHDWIPHLQKLGVGAVLFNPLFESDHHGYDTRDLQKIDLRLGTNQDFMALVAALHEAEIKVVLDGVFNHVGRGFWAFQDVLAQKWDSPYKDWFKIDFGGNNHFNDGFSYRAWEGHNALVELNLLNPAVVEYLLESVGLWIDEFKIDGLRLDVAYMLDHDFMRSLRVFCLEKQPDFFLLGEQIHGDCKQIVNPQMLHSATNYSVYKSAYSAFNSMNLFEVAHAIQRQNGPEDWALCRGINLFNFVDNHDVSRIASVLLLPEHLPLIYTLLFGMPGIPSIYYGSEWGINGLKTNSASGDDAIRPALAEPQWNALSEHIAALAAARASSKALCYGDYKSILLTNKQFIFERRFEEERIMVAINAEAQDYVAHFDAQCGRAMNLITQQPHDFGGGSVLPAYSSAIWKPY